LKKVEKIQKLPSHFNSYMNLYPRNRFSRPLYSVSKAAHSSYKCIYDLRNIHKSTFQSFIQWSNRVDISIKTDKFGFYIMSSSFPQEWPKSIIFSSTCCYWDEAFNGLSCVAVWATTGSQDQKPSNIHVHTRITIVRAMGIYL
jgi:hypothetical protein